MKKMVFALLLICFSAVQARADTVLGITTAEIANWASRAASGPYKSAGDVSTNSPGDWDRIVANRNTFAANPSLGRWLTPFTSGGCVPSSENTYGWPEAASEGGSGHPWSVMLRDAAFYNLVMGVTTDHAALKAELLWVSSQTFTQWGNSSGIWCFGVMWDIAPSFGITAVLTRLLYAYDYMGRAAFTQGELDQLDQWFYDAADFWRRDMDVAQDDKFVDRWNGDYSRTQACEGTPDIRAGYIGGPNLYSYNQYNTNRRGSIIRYVAVAGTYLQQVGRNYTTGRYGNQSHLIPSGAMFFKEFIRFGVMPQGVFGDFARREDDAPDLGWQYSGNTLGEAVMLADIYARSGDTSLYTYNTADGTCGSEGTINDGGSRVGENRDLLFAVQSYMKYSTDIYERYHLNDGNPDFRIDGRDPRDGSTTHGVHDTIQAPANMYFRDSFIKSAYMRTHAGSVPYGSNPVSGPPVWMGEVGTLPGVLFMYGNMEDNAANPYLTGEPPPPSGSGQLELRVIRKLQ